MILGIETSSKTCSVAVSFEGSVLGEISINGQLTHSETLMPMVQNLLFTLNIDISEIKTIALSSGPGSFTGLRIGASAALGLAFSQGIGIVHVPTLEALAYNLINIPKLVVPIMDARRGEVYTAAFKNGVRVTQDLNIPFEDLLIKINELGEEAIFLGDAALLYEVNRPSENLLFARASSLCLLAPKYEEASCTNINYLRKPEAQRKYDENNKK